MKEDETTDQKCNFNVNFGYISLSFSTNEECIVLVTYKKKGYDLTSLMRFEKM